MPTNDTCLESAPSVQKPSSTSQSSNHPVPHRSPATTQSHIAVRQPSSPTSQSDNHPIPHRSPATTQSHIAVRQPPSPTSQSGNHPVPHRSPATTQSHIAVRQPPSLTSQAGNHPVPHRSPATRSSKCRSPTTQTVVSQPNTIVPQLRTVKLQPLVYDIRLPWRECAGKRGLECVSHCGNSPCNLAVTQPNTVAVSQPQAFICL